MAATIKVTQTRSTIGTLANLLFSFSNKTVPRAKDFIYLRDALCT